ncbi:rubrerythrin family protein [bacterium]|nr:rubrerythrin family protein [bacterium]
MGYQTEIDAAFLYRTLAALEPRPEIADVYTQLAGIEDRHAAQQFALLKGADMPELRPSRRARILAWLARRFGAQLILSTLSELERGLASGQTVAKTKLGIPLSGRENTHARILDAIRQNGSRGASGDVLAKIEGRHHTVGGNALRAAVLGANDGLVSNLSLVMGVAGAQVSDNSIIIAGMAGLLAGATSMALGEWISVQSSRELFERQIAVEADELETDPHHEAVELSLIYQAKGMSKDEADRLGARLLAEPQQALDTLVREELGIDPEELGGSAWEAALTSFFLFAVGAILPVIPFWFLSGWEAIVTSGIVSAVGLFVLGAAITLLTGRSVWFSGFRQLIFGLLAAAVTFTIGHWLGVMITG